MPGRASSKKPLTSFIGRRAEVERFELLLANNRLLTLTGTGGVGKTRLAIALASRVADAFAGEVHVVELASLVDEVLVPMAVASALGIADQSERSALGALAQAIGERRLLVVLDNCEHVISAGADLVHVLLRSCEGVHFLATSREPLRWMGK